MNSKYHINKRSITKRRLDDEGVILQYDGIAYVGVSEWSISIVLN
jgi:hypothetical protein